MKHLKTFENYTTEETNEIFSAARKFITGHESGQAKEESRQRIESEIDNAIAKYNENPEIYIKYDTIKLKEKLLQAAKEDNFRGKISVRKSPGKDVRFANKYFIVYDKKLTGLQNIGQAASGAYLKY